MTERVTIEGHGLTVKQDQADPKRRRPERFDPSPVPGGFRTIQQTTEAGNPFWSPEANAAAEASSLPPKVLAQRWAGHRVMPETNHYE